MLAGMRPGVKPGAVRAGSRLQVGRVAVDGYVRSAGSATATCKPTPRRPERVGRVEGSLVETGNSRPSAAADGRGDARVRNLSLRHGSSRTKRESRTDQYRGNVLDRAVHSIPNYRALKALTHQGRASCVGRHCPATCPGQPGCSVAAIPVLPLVRSPDRYHQAAQQYAQGCKQQPNTAAFHTSHSSPLPANRTGLGRRSPCPAGSYQHSRTGRCLLPEPTFRPREMGPKRGSSPRVPGALPFGTRLSTD